MVGFAFIIPDGSLFLNYFYDKYEFVPLSLAGINSGISELTSDKTDAPFYSLSGVRVAKPRKGIYIQNSRKVVVK